VIQVYRKEGYRSNPMVNQDEDMIPSGNELLRWRRKGTPRAVTTQ
jgi:hypothetical protein